MAKNKETPAPQQAKEPLPELTPTQREIVGEMFRERKAALDALNSCNRQIMLALGMIEPRMLDPMSPVNFDESALKFVIKE